jgi:Ribbon-helix-helix protein, copG family
MTVTISLPPDAEARLREQAAAAGKDISTLVREAVEEKLATTNGAKIPPVQSADDFDKALDEFFAANPEKLPSLPTDFSREDIYSDQG